MPLSSESFASLLQSARAQDCSNGNLWTSLRAGVDLDETNFIQFVRDTQLIEVFGVTPESPSLAIDTVEHPKLAQAAVWVRAKHQIFLLCDDPWASDAVVAQSRRRGAGLALALPEQITALQKAGSTGEKPSPSSMEQPTAPELESDVVRFVDQAIAHAYIEGVSDIHFETDRQGVSVKYRLDGVMAPGPKLPNPQRAEEVISRIKVMAQLDITERRRPQDGRIHWKRAANESLDLRVSIMPSIFGEDAVLRLLDKAQLRQNQTQVSISVLGFDADVADKIRAQSARPHGMLLVTGPTGSGKTTTLYAALTEVNTGLEKIITIEDPVEYELPGVLQIPVNEQKGLTFATGLRSILRHDPDKILVGEIRDAETAEIAVQSSLTGHLVFTTVHANSLFDVLGRFQHFGIDPFGLASAVNCIVVQRLFRRVCPHCVSRRPVTTDEGTAVSLFGVTDLQIVPLAIGCSHCRQTGYKGRFVVAEMHEFNDVLRDLIVSKPTMSQLRQTIFQEPSDRLLSKALAKVANGNTTLEEVARVVGLV